MIFKWHPIYQKGPNPAKELSIAKIEKLLGYI